MALHSTAHSADPHSPVMPFLVASVAQCGTVYNDTPGTLSKMRELAKTARERDHSQLIVFPEAFIGGYPKFSTFGVSVGTRSLEGRKEFVEYYKNAIPVPGREISEIEAISKEENIFIVTGFIEKAQGTLYCSVGFFHPVKGFLYRRRKLMPTAAERLIWGFGSEEDTKVVRATFETNGKRPSERTAPPEEELILSSAICWENMMPLLRAHYYQQGTQIHCVPTVDGRENWEHIIRTIALEGRCFVLSCCQFSQQKHFPEGHPIEGERDPEAVMIAGGSMIISPLGEVLAGPLRGEEGILSATLRLDDIIAGKFDLDVVGHYARPDLFKLVAPQ